MQEERDSLLAEIENLAANSDGNMQKMKDTHSFKLKALETQVMTMSYNFFVLLPWTTFLAKLLCNSITLFRL